MKINWLDMAVDTQFLVKLDAIPGPLYRREELLLPIYNQVRTIASIVVNETLEMK